MSNKLAVWLSEKMGNLETKVEATKDLGERMNILNDYSLVLTGAADALEAAGATGHEHAAEALDVVSSMMDSTEKRMKLAEKLGS